MVLSNVLIAVQSPVPNLLIRRAENMLAVTVPVEISMVKRLCELTGRLKSI